jgi:hypothetical protein
MLGLSFLTCSIEEDRERVLNAWTRSVKTGEDYMIDARLIRGLDGTAR